MNMTVYSLPGASPDLPVLARNARPFIRAVRLDLHTMIRYLLGTGRARDVFRVGRKYRSKRARISLEVLEHEHGEARVEIRISNHPRVHAVRADVLLDLRKGKGRVVRLDGRGALDTDYRPEWDRIVHDRARAALLGPDAPRDELLRRYEPLS